MKKHTFLLLFAGLLAALSFVSCNNETDSESEEEEYKLLCYKKLVGNSFELIQLYDYNEEAVKKEFGKYECISFSNTSITANGVTYPFNPQSDLYYYEEIENSKEVTAEPATSPCDFYIFVNGRYLGIDDFDPTGADDRLTIKMKVSNLSDDYYTSLIYYAQCFKGHYALVSTSDSSSSDSSDGSSSGSDSSSGSGSSSSSTTSSVNGTYTYTATGTAQSGSLTLKDGTWSYSGDKTALSVKSGSYTVSGSKITVSWSSNGYDSTETFTISNSGSQSTWTKENESVSVFFVTIFTNSSKTLTFTKS